jgi:hypothetical protein
LGSLVFSVHKRIPGGSRFSTTVEVLPAALVFKATDTTGVRSVPGLTAASPAANRLKLLPSLEEPRHRNVDGGAPSRSEEAL